MQTLASSETFLQLRVHQLTQVQDGQHEQMVNQLTNENQALQAQLAQNLEGSSDVQKALEAKIFQQAEELSHATNLVVQLENELQMFKKSPDQDADARCDAMQREIDNLKQRHEQQQAELQLEFDHVLQLTTERHLVTCRERDTEMKMLAAQMQQNDLSQVAQLTELLSEATSSISNLQIKLHVLETTCDELTLQLENKSRDHEQLSKLHAQLQNTALTLQTETKLSIAELRQELAGEQERSRDYSSQLLGLNEAVSQVTSEKQAIQLQLDYQQSQNSKSTHDIHELNAKLAEVSLLAVQLSEATSTISNLQREMCLVEAKCNELAQELQSKSRELDQTQMEHSRLQTVVQDAQTASQSLIAELKENIQKEQAHVQTLNAHVEQQDAVIAQLTSETRQLQTHRESLQTQTEATQQLQKDFQAKNLETSQLTEQLRSVEGKCNELTQVLQSKSRELDLLSHTHAQLESTVLAEHSEKQTLIAELKEKVLKEQSQVRDLSARNEQMNTSVSQLTGESQRLQSHLASLQTQSSEASCTFQKDLEAKETKISHLEQQLTEAAHSVSNLQATCEALKQQVQSKTRESDEANQHRIHATQALSILQSEKDTSAAELTEKLLKHQTECQRVNVQLQEQTAQVNKLNDQLQEAKSLETDLEHKLDIAQASIKALQETISQLTTTANNIGPSPDSKTIHTTATSLSHLSETCDMPNDHQPQTNSQMEPASPAPNQQSISQEHTPAQQAQSTTQTETETPTQTPTQTPHTAQTPQTTELRETQTPVQTQAQTDTTAQVQLTPANESATPESYPSSTLLSQLQNRSRKLASRKTVIGLFDQGPAADPSAPSSATIPAAPIVLQQSSTQRDRARSSAAPEDSDSGGFMKDLMKNDLFLRRKELVSKASRKQQAEQIRSGKVQLNHRHTIGSLQELIRSSQVFQQKGEGEQK
eukprot:c8491_g1_i1.p1 GENE.c8491_g1_i1~~c8491_g1_i1.p1  ORF type:complete len:939 (+),score=267.73 c8491_g1_i1:1088-3904(+)